MIHYLQKKSILLILVITLFVPIQVSADLWTDMDNLATSTYEQVVGFPFASTTAYTEQLLKSTYVFPLGFLNEQASTLISYFIILLVFIFAFAVFKFYRT